MKQAILAAFVAIFVSMASAQESNRAGKTTALPVSKQAQVSYACPVMEGKKVNTRLYVDYNGYRIYVCCNACVKALNRNPAKYLKYLQDHGAVLEKIDRGVGVKK